MRHLFTLLLLGGSLECFGQITRDSEPAAQSQCVWPDSAQQQPAVYICDSKLLMAYHKDEDCRGLNRCMHAVVKATNREVEEDYGREPCQMCC